MFRLCLLDANSGVHSASQLRLQAGLTNKTAIEITNKINNERNRYKRMESNEQRVKEMRQVAINGT